MPPALLFFLKIALAIQVFWFVCWLVVFFSFGSVQILGVFSISIKKAIGICIEIALNLQMALGSLDILTILY